MVLSTSGRGRTHHFDGRTAGKAVLDCDRGHSYILLQAGTAHWIVDGFEIATLSPGIGPMMIAVPRHTTTISRNHIHHIGNHVQNTSTGITGFYSGPLSYNMTFKGNVWGPALGGPAWAGRLGPKCFHDPCAALLELQPRSCNLLVRQERNRVAKHLLQPLARLGRTPIGSRTRRIRGKRLGH